ncbi:MAG TPA: NHL repeat-containing protein, partial [Candidatus Binataceae bacterium]
MRSRSSFVACKALAGIALGFLIVGSAFAFPPGFGGDTVADRVLGQFDFFHNAPNTPDQDTFATGGDLAAVAIDTSVTPNRLYVADALNNRVLGYSSVAAPPLANGVGAFLVIGQPDFFSTGCPQPPTAKSLCRPRGVAVDSAGNLYVSDSLNDRVLEYSTPFSSGFRAGQAAHVVYGQAGNFTGFLCNNNGGAPNANSLCQPEGLVLDKNGNLYVADHNNNRVLEYNTPATASITPSRVFGQPGFVSSIANNGGLTNKALDGPTGVAADSFGNLYVTDNLNNRVLEYNTPITTVAPGGSGAAAKVWGQGGSFTTNACTASAQGLCAPAGVGLDAANNLYIADSGFNRILEYNEGANPPTNTTANRVFGQGGSFSTTACSTLGASALCNPQGVALDQATIRELFVMDSNNNRALKFNSPLVSQTANVVLGQFDFLHNVANTVDTDGLNTPHGIAVDSSNHLYVVDLSNNRVLGYASAASFANGGAPTLVIGQPDFFSGRANQGGAVSQLGLNTPSAVAVDKSNNLYVSDFSNNRILEYNSPFAQVVRVNLSANRVYGQFGLFTTNGCNQGGTVTKDTLCGPDGLALDNSPTQNLYVADRSNHRVLRYTAPLANSHANFEFGQGAGSGTDFADNTCNAGGLSAVSLCNPFGVVIDKTNHLYIADHDNNRVLEYNTPLTSATANLEFGQGNGNGSDFTQNPCNSPALNAASLCGPHKLAVDSANNLYVSDNGNHRVLEFNTPLTKTAVAGSGDTTADHVFGQANNLGSNRCNLGGGAPSPSSLCNPVGVALDSVNDLLVGDFSNDRVLQYVQPLAGPGVVT